MQMIFVKKLVIAGMVPLLASPAGFGQVKPKPPSRDTSPRDMRQIESRPIPSGAGFYIGAIEGGKGLFSVLLTDASGKSVAGTFTLQQIEIFEAVLEAAKEFASTNEKVGTGKPIVTRLMDQHEWSMFVDVSKIGDESRLYVSLITPAGKLTTEAGEISRGSKKFPKPLLLKMLSQLQEAKANSKIMQ